MILEIRQFFREAETDRLLEPERGVRHGSHLSEQPYLSESHGPLRQRRLPDAPRHGGKDGEICRRLFALGAPSDVQEDVVAG